MAAPDIRNMIKEQCIPKILVVAQIMSELIDCSGSEACELEIKDTVVYILEHYSWLWNVVFEDIYHIQPNFNDIPEWLLRQDMSFLDGLLIFIQMTLSIRNNFFETILELKSDDEDENITERKEDLLAQIMKGG